MKKWIGALWGVGVLCWSAPTVASTPSSMGEVGIDAARLHAPPYDLLGRKIGIGQVEIGRPGVFGIDKAIPAGYAVAPHRVFLRDENAKVNDHLDSHAQNVAGIMISQSKKAPGVAPAARLYASASPGGFDKQRQAQECLASQHVALQNGSDVRAINFSFGEPLALDPRPDAVLDGNALLTLCIDWSAQEHDVLYVIAGNQGTGGIPIPTDNFNGINVAFSTYADGSFSRVDVANLGSVFAGSRRRLEGLEGNVGLRRSINLLAPGRNVTILDPDGRVRQDSGTSFAAPHVVGTVALIQEYGDRQLRNNDPQWTVDARRHEVTKAVLLNSADKIEDTGDGLRLGMTRTILDKDNLDWLDSDAYKDETIPLHGQTGTGHLNAYRALQQFSPGQYAPNAAVPPIGWDYNTVGVGQSQEYALEKPLQEGSYVSVTLAWNRLVELEDANSNGMFEVTEEFRDRGLNDLNLYLVRADGSVAQVVRASISAEDSVEHIFFPVPETGRYTLRVTYAKQIHEPTQPYALAWWTVPAQ